MCDGGLKIDANIIGAQDSTLDALDGINRDLANAQAASGPISTSLKGFLETMRKVRVALAAANPALADVSAVLGNSRDISGTIISDAFEFAAMMGQASTNTQEALNESSAAADSVVSNAASKLIEVNPQP